MQTIPVSSRIYTTTMTHKRGGGDGTLTTVSSDIKCTPADAISPNDLRSDYPTEKTFSLRQIFTGYTAVEEGDYVEINSTLYAVRVVNLYDALTPMVAYCQLIVEKELVYSV